MSGHSRNKQGKYIVRMPFNKKMTQSFAMEHRMRKNPEFAIKYKVFMN